jgi:2-polyprenyl-3-methyl-5-hydroxy-6-metoxy-1,4-benzoquinol methylase
MERLTTAKLCPQNYARTLVLELFLNELKNFDKLPVELKVGVLGGGIDEPEILALRAIDRKIEVRTIGLDGSDINMDLNYIALKDGYGEKFDLILCSQVLEHVWNHNNFFINLNSLVEQDGLVWLAAPAANHPHGSPDFFSPGFTHSYLKQNLENNGFQVVSSGSIGSKRLYFAAVFLARWLTVAEHESPLIEVIRPSNLLKNIYDKKRIFHLMLVEFLSPKVSCDSRFVTESWALAVNQAQIKRG